MKGLPKGQLHQVKEAFDLASFCKKWWKSLSKELKKSGVNEVQKMQVLCKLSNGLIKEALLYTQNHDDVCFVIDSAKDTYMECKVGYDF